MRACTYVARPHDAPAIRHLLQRPMSGLLEDPGCGKTGQVLAAMVILKKRKLIDRMLAFAPLNPTYEVWGPQIEEWGFPLTWQILHGPKKDRRIDELADVNCINYEGLEWLAENFGRVVRPGERWWVVFDESTKIKHTNTKRFKLLRHMLPAFARRTVLTGTPSPNGLEDLFGQVYAVDLGASLGRYITQYRREYFYPSGYGGYKWVPQDGAEQRIYKKLGTAFYRVSDKVLKLKPMHAVPLYVRLPPKAQKVYDNLEQEFVAELKRGIVTAANAGVLSSKLRQVANGTLYGDGAKPGRRMTHVVHDAKLDALGDLLEQLQGNPLLIGYEFTADGERIAKAFGLPILNGSTSRKDKVRLFKEFNDGKLQGLVVQTGAAAHGLNLQKVCHTVALYGLTWNLETYLQFRKRVHRAGQRKTVMVHHIIARGTIDETVWQVLREKNSKQQALLSAVKKRYK